MKQKQLIFTFVLALCASFIQAQTIVSTTPENKNVILEEFTGIHCGYCPQGHAIAQGLQNSNPGDVYLINVHVGGFSTPGAGEPDFRTSFGTALDNQAQPGTHYYPSATANRVFFPSLTMGGGTAMGRGDWGAASAQILGESSYLNVGVEASIDVQTRELTVHVEVYYTGNSPETTNLLNIALLQNNTEGPQTSGGMGDEYNHMHRLVHLITGQWGQTISTTTAGSFVDETFTYTIPADYKSIAAKLADMEIVAFVSETHQNIISGSGAYPTYTNFSNANDALVQSIGKIETTCQPVISPEITIQNNGSNPLTSVDINYSVNGGTSSTYNWTGNLAPLQEETITLSNITFNSQTTNTLNVTLGTDDDASNNTDTANFVIGGTGSVNMVLKTDSWGEDCTWNVKDSSGTVLYSGGPYPSQDNSTIYESFQLPNDCITFNIMDSFGDGGNQVTFTDSNGIQLFELGPAYGTGTSQEFNSNGLGIENIGLQNSISIYPNPASDYIHIDNAENTNVSVYSILGKKVISQTGISSKEQLNVSQLQIGTYIVKIEGEDGAVTEKLVITE